MSGRGLRLAPGKKDCLLLDFCENFKRLGFVTKKHPISLCPQFKFGNASNIKECPACHASVYSFAKVCPECGYEFSPGEPEDEDGGDNFIPDFGEMLSDEDRIKVSYLRSGLRRTRFASQLKRGYKKGLNPDRIWPLFRKKFGHLPPNDWHIGAVFRGLNSQFQVNDYREFLYRVNPSATEHWLKFQLELEFGNRNKKYKTASGKPFTPPPVSTKRLEWWVTKTLDITGQPLTTCFYMGHTDLLTEGCPVMSSVSLGELLDVSPLDEWSEIKSAYRRLAKQWHPDVSEVDEATAKIQMQLLNWAFEQAKESRL